MTITTSRIATLATRYNKLWSDGFISTFDWQRICENLIPALDQYCDEHRIPAQLADTALTVYLPLTIGLFHDDNEHKPQVLGISGGQGSGKSTMASFIRFFAEQIFDLKAVILSIDDIYLTKDERQKLANTVHPLLATRGVPGTHDIHLGKQLIESLLTAEDDKTTNIVRFDKLSDDRLPEEHWESFTGRPDFVIFEGWCIGAEAQPTDQLTFPINTLESEEDKGGTWRHWVNQQLTDTYPELFDLIDQQIYIKVPSIDSVYNWRQEQEEGLKKSDKNKVRAKGMTGDELQRFIMHYQRITEYMVGSMTKKADWYISLDSSHNITKIIAK